MKVFKINVSVVYNDDEITEEIICDNIFNTMQGLNDKLVILNIDDIKEMSRTNQVVTRLLKDIVKEPVQNVKSNKSDKKEYLEINKSSNVENTEDIKNITNVKKEKDVKTKKKNTVRKKNNENKN